MDKEVLGDRQVVAGWWEKLDYMLIEGLRGKKRELGVRAYVLMIMS